MDAESDPYKYELLQLLLVVVLGLVHLPLYWATAYILLVTAGFFSPLGSSSAH